MAYLECCLLRSGLRLARVRFDPVTHSRFFFPLLFLSEIAGLNMQLACIQLTELFIPVYGQLQSMQGKCAHGSQSNTASMQWER